MDGPAQAVWDRPFLCLFCSIQALNRWRVSAHTGEGDLPFSPNSSALMYTFRKKALAQALCHPLVQASRHINLTITATAVPGSGAPTPQHCLLH